MERPLPLRPGESLPQGSVVQHWRSPLPPKSFAVFASGNDFMAHQRVASGPLVLSAIYLSPRASPARQRVDLLATRAGREKHHRTCFPAPACRTAVAERGPAPGRLERQSELKEKNAELAAEDAEDDAVLAVISAGCCLDTAGRAVVCA